MFGGRFRIRDPEENARFDQVGVKTIRRDAKCERLVLNRKN
jgi:hypothetical protein